MEQTQIAIVGGGLASAKAIGAYREAGGEDSVALLSADTAPPYHRPPLSKRILRGEAEPGSNLVEPQEFYREHGVDLRLATRVDALDLDARVLTLSGGEQLGFSRVVIATGATPRRLDVPGSELDGVHTLRTLDDVGAIRARAEGASRAVVVGTGFIGLETAASLRARGLDVTLVGSGRSLFGALGVPAFSEHLATVYRDQGVDLRLAESVAAFMGDGSLEGARLTGGDEVDADLAIVGVGVEPDTGWLEGSGIELDDGVVVDERYAASADDVWAIGDVASFHDPVFGRRRRIEHWSNASYQGADLGRLLAGGEGGYSIVSSFFTEIFGTTYKVFGDSHGSDELVQEGEFGDGPVAVHHLREGKRVAALVSGQSEEREAELKDAIRARATL